MLLRQSLHKVVAHGHHHLECRGVAVNTQLGIGPVASSLPVMGSSWIGTATAVSTCTAYYAKSYSNTNNRGVRPVLAF